MVASMSEPRHSRRVAVRNPQGLHARPAEMFARLALTFDATIEVVKDGQRVDAKSILHILTLGAEQGQELLLEATGHDAQAALDALAELTENEFSLDTNENQSS